MNNEAMKCQQDYPMVLRVEHIAEITGLGKNNCYFLMRSAGFPAFKPIGQARYLVPRDAFFTWLYSSANAGERGEI